MFKLQRLKIRIPNSLNKKKTKKIFGNWKIIEFQRKKTNFKIKKMYFED